ncbi:MAG: laccase domain-containing protein, partial [Tetrasphaera sp.]|nr:laccase domain-containing protein [Tetrasphaera sp.]
ATGTPALDIATGVLAQLSAAGVSARQVLGCTRESGSLYSYRRDGVTGRHAGIILLRPPAAHRPGRHHPG